MRLDTFCRWMRDASKEKIIGTILTRKMTYIPALGMGMVSSSDPEDIVKCEISSYRCTNNDFSYKIVATPLTDEDKMIYGQKTYYTSDFESLMSSLPEFTIEGFTPELIDRMGMLKAKFRKEGLSMKNDYPKDSIENFYLNELITNKREDDVGQAIQEREQALAEERGETYDW